MKPSLAPRVSEWTEGENRRNVERAGEKPTGTREKERKRENCVELCRALRYSTSFTRNFPSGKSFRASARRAERTHRRHEVLFAVVVSTAGRPGRQELRQSLLRRRWWVLVRYSLFSCWFPILLCKLLLRHAMREFVEKFGFGRSAWKDAAKASDIFITVSECSRFVDRLLTLQLFGVLVKQKFIYSRGMNIENNEKELYEDYSVHPFLPQTDSWIRCASFQ